MKLFPALNAYGASTVFIVWNSTPGLAGSSKLRIAECSPGTDGLMLTTSGVATFFASVIDAGVLNVPSLPTQLRLNVRGLLPPFVRVIV